MRMDLQAAHLVFNNLLVVRVKDGVARSGVDDQWH